MLLPLILVQDLLHGSEAVRNGRDQGRAAPRSSPDRRRYLRVSRVDAFVAHSRGAAFSIDTEVRARRLAHRRRVPGQRTRGSPVVVAGKNILAAHRCRCSKSRAGPSLAVCMVLYHSSELIYIIKR